MVVRTALSVIALQLGVRMASIWEKMELIIAISLIVQPETAGAINPHSRAAVFLG